MKNYKVYQWIDDMYLGRFVAIDDEWVYYVDSEGSIDRITFFRVRLTDEV